MPIKRNARADHADHNHLNSSVAHEKSENRPFPTISITTCTSTIRTITQIASFQNCDLHVNALVHIPHQTISSEKQPFQF
jgi:hypothetical protein